MLRTASGTYMCCMCVIIIFIPRFYFGGLWFLYLFILICFHLQGAHIIPSFSGAVMDFFFLENVFSVIFLDLGDLGICPWPDILI